MIISHSQVSKADFRRMSVGSAVHRSSALSAYIKALLPVPHAQFQILLLTFLILVDRISKLANTES